MNIYQEYFNEIGDSEHRPKAVRVSRRAVSVKSRKHVDADNGYYDILGKIEVRLQNGNEWLVFVSDKIFAGYSDEAKARRLANYLQRFQNGLPNLMVEKVFHPSVGTL